MTTDSPQLTKQTSKSVPPQTVVNFYLSKDIHYAFKVKINKLSGLTQKFQQLQQDHYLNYSKSHASRNHTTSGDSSEKATATDKVITYKLKEQQTNEVFISVSLLSGNGNEKLLTCPIVTSVRYFNSNYYTVPPTSYHTESSPPFSTGRSTSHDGTRNSSRTSTSTASSVGVTPGTVGGASSLNFLAAQRMLYNNPDWLTLPINYSQLPIDSVLFFNIYSFDYEKGDLLQLGTCKLNVFDYDGACTLFKGHQKLKIDVVEGINSKNKEGIVENINTPINEVARRETEMQRLEKKLKLKENGELASGPDWLDPLTYRKIEQINSAEISKQERESQLRKSLRDSSLDDGVFLHVELLQFDIPIVFSDVKYAVLSIPTSETHGVGGSSPSNAVRNTGNYEVSNEITFSNSMSLKTDPSIFKTFDPDLYRSELVEDPIEYKFRKLERIHQLSSLDKDVRPTLKIRQQLNRILQKQFFEKLGNQERRLIWKFRFYLLNALILNKNTSQFNNFLINFIKCIDWDEDFEVNEFLTIINDLDPNKNSNSNNGDNGLASNVFVQELEIVDCLELLSENYRNHIVRNMAIERLKLANDDELEMFMVQLVQSIKNERNYVNPHTDIDEDDNYADLDNQLNSPAVTTGDTEDSVSANSEFHVIKTDEASVDPIVKFLNSPYLLSSKKRHKLSSKVPKLDSPLANFIIERAANNSNLMNFLYWNLKVEVDEERKNNSKTQTALGGNGTGIGVGFEEIDYIQDQLIDNNQQLHRSQIRTTSHIFEKSIMNFIWNLAISEDGDKKVSELRTQVELVGKLRDIAVKIKVDYKKETTPRKVEILKSLLVEKHKKKSAIKTLTDTASPLRPHRKSILHTEQESLVEFTPIGAPIDPRIKLCGTIPEESTVFKSSLNPLKVSFKTTTDSKYPLMFKIGDDLRQDQFVVQIITVMEKILRNENLDLKLRPYKILATSTVEGFIEFVPNSSLSSILSKYNNSILAYLQHFNPDPTAPHGVLPEVMDNYVRSCAGYCVVTYILGVGDRHLENLLLTKDGYFFHADFGYILGQDPKPFPPLMKLPIQIIEGMGGLNDENYKKFCDYCFTSYNTLRKNSSLILNLFQLMIDSSIPILQTPSYQTQLSNGGNINNVNSGSTGGGNKNVTINETEKLEIILKIKEKFMLELNDEEAILHFQNLINNSISALFPVVIDRLHTLAQYWRA